MTTIQEKYEKFMISDELKVHFDKLSNNYLCKEGLNQIIFVKKIENKNGVFNVISQEVKNA